MKAPPRTGALLIAVAAVGVLCGIAGIVFTLILHGVQHLVFGYTENTFLVGVQEASYLRRVLALVAAGIVAGLGWWWIRARMARGVGIGEAVWRTDGRMPFWQSQADALLQIVIVGMGASLGREGAPRESAAAATSVLADRLGLPVRDRRLLVACAGGAGLAAVYGVPLAGALFTIETLLISLSPAVIVLAGSTSAIAVGVAWTVLPTDPIYHVESAPATLSVFVFALVAGPLFGGAGLLLVRLLRWAKGPKPQGWRLLVSTTATFGAIGVVSIAYPQVLGNGKGAVDVCFTGAATLGLLAALTILKPAATAASLRSGANGGQLTPVLATGALLGGTVGYLWNDVWSLGVVGPASVIGTAAVFAVVGRAPLTAIALVWEITDMPFWLLAAVAVSVLAALLSTWRWRGDSMYAVGRPDQRRGQWRLDSWRTAAAAVAAIAVLGSAGLVR